jgi:hypothetical protein
MLRGRPKRFQGRPAESANALAPSGLKGKPGLKKICAVGLEMRVPAAPVTGHEIPSGNRLAGAMPSKCELVHNRAHPNGEGASVPPDHITDQGFEPAASTRWVFLLLL